MLYDEFIQGTGCKDTAYNYKVYKDLEILYMNSDHLTKADIYEYGKKLVDNSLTESQIEWNKDIDRQIAELQKQVDYYNGEIEYYKQVIEMWTGYDEDCVKSGKYQVKRCRREARYYRNKIRDLKISSLILF